MLEYAIGQGYSALDAQAWRDALDGYAVVSGLGVTVDTGLDITVATGEATVGTTGSAVDTVTLASPTTLTLSADSTSPKKYTVYIDTAGTVQLEEGLAEAAEPSANVRFNTYQPEPPLPSTDGTVLAEVWVAAQETTLQAADIRDRRVPATFAADAVVADDVTVDESFTDAAGVSHTGELEDIAHGSKHENGGSDEISVAGLSGDLADEQDPKAHANEHSADAVDEVSVEDLGTTGASGDVPKSQGDGTLAMEAIQVIDPQGYSDVAGSRSAGTEYQNTTGRPIEVKVVVSDFGGVLDISSRVSSTSGLTGADEVDLFENDNGGSLSAFTTTTIVPDLYYYEVVVNSGSIDRWSEQEL